MSSNTREPMSQKPEADELLEDTPSQEEELDITPSLREVEGLLSEGGLDEEGECPEGCDPEHMFADDEEQTGGSSASGRSF